MSGCPFGSVPQRRQLEMADRLIAADELQSARAIVHGVLDSLPTFAEASRLLGSRQFCQRPHPRCSSQLSASDHRQSLPVSGRDWLGELQRQIGQDAAGAVRWFRRALRINPELEMIRLHVAQLTQSPDQP